MSTTLSWNSPLRDFEHAAEATIVDLYERSESVTEHSSRTRRLTETVLVKAIAIDGEREYHNHCFAWKSFHSEFLRIPRPLRYFEVLAEDTSTLGYLVMEFLNGTPLDKATGVDPAVVARAIHHLHEHPVSARTPGPLTGGHVYGFPWGGDGTRTFRSLEDLQAAVNVRLQLYARRNPQAPGKSIFNFDDSKLAFCHMDLALRNILVLQDGAIAIVDWMTLGVYPVLFETASLSFLAENADGQHKDFLNVIKNYVGNSKSEGQSKMLRIVHYMNIRYSFS